MRALAPRNERTLVPRELLGLIRVAYRTWTRSRSVGYDAARDPGHRSSDSTLLERIFRMFHAVSPERGTSGVGLAIVKKLVERNGGSVSVESAPGAGATFRFSIPKRQG